MDKEEIDRIAEQAEKEKIIEELLRALRDYDTEYDANLFLDRGILFYCLEFALCLLDEYEEEMWSLVMAGFPALDQPTVDRLIKACFPELPEEGYVADVVQRMQEDENDGRS